MLQQMEPESWSLRWLMAWIYSMIHWHTWMQVRNNDIVYYTTIYIIIIYIYIWILFLFACICMQRHIWCHSRVYFLVGKMINGGTVCRTSLFSIGTPSQWMGNVHSHVNLSKGSYERATRASRVWPPTNEDATYDSTIWCIQCWWKIGMRRLPQIDSVRGSVAKHGNGKPQINKDSGKTISINGSCSIAMFELREGNMVLKKHGCIGEYGWKLGALFSGDPICVCIYIYIHIPSPTFHS